MEHHHHHIDDESNEVVSTIISEIVDDEESHLKVVSQYQITDHGEDSTDDGMNGSLISIDTLTHCNKTLTSIGSSYDDHSVNGKQICNVMKNGSGISSYRQKYKKVWESVPELKDWLLPFAGNPHSAFCKYCRCQLHAHKKGLLSHSKSSKHKKSVAGQIAALSTKETSNGVSFTNQSSLTNGDLSHKKAIFNENWLKEPFFKPWLRKIPHNSSKALCIACRSILVAGRSELVKHTIVAKHKRAITEGFSEDLSDLDLNWLSPDYVPGLVVMAAPKSHGGSSSNTNIHGDGTSLEEVVKCLDKISPLHLAEAWDNVGLLVKPSNPLNVNLILVTNDLTQDVMAEAVDKKVNLIISYHPPIFRPLKRLVGGSWKESIITSCIESRIALYSPHTALDAIKGGINDWLIESFGDLAEVKPITQSTCDPRANTSNCVDFVSGSEIPTEISNLPSSTYKTCVNDSSLIDVRVCCNDDMLPKLYQNFNEQSSPRLVKLAAPPIPGVGMGRVGRLKNGISISQAIEKVKYRAGINHVRLAIAPIHSLDSKVEKIAVCAGSGFSLISQVKADLIVTGEMSHHEVLDCIHKGSTVILTEHSNSERGYLNTIYLNNLKRIFGPSINIIASTFDFDPLKVI